MKYLFLLFFLFCGLVCRAQERIFLYTSTEKVTHEGFDKDSIPPFIEYYKAHPDSANGSAILICPGGAYTHLAFKKEGTDVAQFYNQYGFDTFVLRYRLNSGDQKGHRHPDQYRDVTTAIRLVKSRAKEWKLDPNRVGIVGFSAGGHLASMCATMHIPANPKSRNPIEQWSSRPSFAILIYPVIKLAGKPAHNYSREMLLGKNPNSQLVDSLSTHNRVTAHTPPTFLVYANDDNGVPPENGLSFYKALRKHNIPSSLMIYDHGGHGFGMAPTDPVLNTWPWLSVKWLERMGYRIKN